MARVFWPLTLALLACLGATQVFSARQESQTWDEHLELASGYAYLKTGDYWIIPEHPPLSRVIQALPLLFLPTSLPLNDPSWKNRQVLQFSVAFLYENQTPADTLLFAARSMTILMTLALGLALALWTRASFGPAAALFALLLFSFDPTVISHGHYIKHDIPVTLFAFLACGAWGAWLDKRRASMLWLASLLCGLALATKFSALFLLPVFALLYLISRWLRREPISWMRLAGSLAVVAAITFLVSGAAYAFKLRPLLAGISDFATHARGGHISYLMGSTFEDGRWYYFPVAFAVKTPTATMAALFLCLFLALGKARRTKLREIPFEWYALLVPVLVYLGAMMTSNVDIGLRHLLPLYPFLFIAIGAGLVQMEWKRKYVVLAALGGLVMIESASIYPHYLAFFNAAAGGPLNGPRYLLDSNIDWGQDMKNLKAYMDAHHIPHVCACYFGNANFSYYKIGAYPLPATWETEAREKLDCVAAVSVTPLYGLYVPSGSYDWLRERKPTATIGYSIYIYDLRKAVSY